MILTNVDPNNTGWEFAQYNYKSVLLKAAMMQDYAKYLPLFNLRKFNSELTTIKRQISETMYQ